MKIFVCQTVNGIVRHDFVLETINAVEYAQWRKLDREYVLCDKENLENLIQQQSERLCNLDVIPVGTIEFVDEWIKLIGLYHYKRFIDACWVMRPLNVPESLTGLCKRKIVNWGGYKVNDTERGKQELNKFLEQFPGNHVFIKSTEEIKHQHNGLYKKDDAWVKFLYRDCQVSEHLCGEQEIVSEFRCFFNNFRCVGVQCYSGDFYQKVDPDVIETFNKEMSGINRFGVYTFDVALLKNGEYEFIEAHEFYSCGLYGFCDLRNYDLMLIRAWMVIAERIKKHYENAL